MLAVVKAKGVLVAYTFLLDWLQVACIQTTVNSAAIDTLPLLVAGEDLLS